MEKSPATATNHFEPVLQEQCGIIIFLAFITYSISKIQRFLPSSCQSCSSPVDKAIQTPALVDRYAIKPRSKKLDDEMDLTHEDIKIVMRNIGLGFDQENCTVCNSVGSDFSRLFYDNEPSLQEVNQAFLVFDCDNDGYLDASDLQRVISSLGLDEGVGLHECEEMIARYDMNKDSRIDLVEFTKVLEASIC